MHEKRGGDQESATLVQDGKNLRWASSTPPLKLRLHIQLNSTRLDHGTSWGSRWSMKIVSTQSQCLQRPKRYIAKNGDSRWRNSLPSSDPGGGELNIDTFSVSSSLHKKDEISRPSRTLHLNFDPSIDNSIALLNPFPSKNSKQLRTMAATFPADAISRLAQLPPPQGAADYAALAAVGVASAAYLLRGIAWDRPDPYHHIWFERPSLRDGAVGGGAKATRNIAQKLEESVSQNSNHNIDFCEEHVLMPLSVGKRCRHLLGFAIRHSRNVRQQTRQRMPSPLRPSNIMRRPLRLRLRNHCPHPPIQTRHLRHLNIWRRRPQ